MTDGKPDTKIWAVSAAGAVTTVLVWIIKVLYEVDMPPEVAAALTTIIAAIAGYLAPYSRDVQLAIHEKIIRTYEVAKPCPPKSDEEPLL